MKTVVTFLAVALLISSAYADDEPSIECGEEELAFYPNSQDCTKYFECASGALWEMECPDGLYFNAELSVCDWPESAGCVATAAEIFVPEVEEIDEFIPEIDADLA